MFSKQRALQPEDWDPCLQPLSDPLQPGTSVQGMRALPPEDWIVYNLFWNPPPQKKNVLCVPALIQL